MFKFTFPQQYLKVFFVLYSHKNVIYCDAVFLSCSCIMICDYRFNLYFHNKHDIGHLYVWSNRFSSAIYYRFSGLLLKSKCFLYIFCIFIFCSFMYFNIFPNLCFFFLLSFIKTLILLWYNICHCHNSFHFPV